MKLALLTKDLLLSYLLTHTTPFLIRWLTPAKHGFIPSTGKSKRCFSLERSWQWNWCKRQGEINFWFLFLPSLSYASFSLMCVSERTGWSFDLEKRSSIQVWSGEHRLFNKYPFEEEQHPGFSSTDFFLLCKCQQTVFPIASQSSCSRGMQHLQGGFHLKQTPRTCFL